MTKRISGFDSRLLLGPVIPKTFKNGSGLFFHGTHDDVVSSCMVPRNITGWPGVSIM